MLETSSSEQDRSLEFPRVNSRVIRLMIIELGNYNEVGELLIENVKNGFSHPTREPEGRDRPRKDIMNRHQVKALREGRHEIKEVQTGVSSREKIKHQ